MSQRANKLSGRRRLQWTLGVLVAIPFASAGREIALGPAGVPGGSTAVNPRIRARSGASSQGELS